MSAGSLDRQIQLQEPVLAQSETGESFAQSWTTRATVNAAIEPGSGGESFDADRRTQKQMMQFRIRYRESLTPRWRVLWKGQAYDIKAILEEGRKRYLLLQCEVREFQPGTGVAT